MLHPIMHQLAMKHIVLASSSPRRIALLQSINFPFESIPSTFEENLDPKCFLSPYEFAIETAKQKAIEVANRFKEDIHIPVPNLIIGADTIVTYDNEVFGKPKDRQEAFSMLRRFSSQTHTVCTGMVFVTPSRSGDPLYHVTAFHEKTHVRMSTLSDDIIEAYIDTGEPMDKAGGYGIQGLGGTLIESIQGDYYNVMGFPLSRFCKEICKFIQVEK